MEILILFLAYLGCFSMPYCE